jgi:prephenate dehydrogenase
MRILIIGSNGRLGRTLMHIFPGSTGIDKVNEALLEQEIRKAQLVFLAVPLNATLDIINRYQDYGGFVDLTSVKAPLKKFNGKIISMHPMFGPWSYLTNKNILFINDISPDSTLKMIRDLFDGYNIIPVSADDHDKLMAELLVKPYILSYISDSHEMKTETSSHRKLLELSEIKYAENMDIMLDTIQFNKNTQSVIEEVEEKLDNIKKLIGNRR